MKYTQSWYSLIDSLYLEEFFAFSDAGLNSNLIYQLQCPIQHQAIPTCLSFCILLLIKLKILFRIESRGNWARTQFVNVHISSVIKSATYYRIWSNCAVYNSYYKMHTSLYQRRVL